MNKLSITLEDLFNLTDSVIYNPDCYKTSNNVSIDSRNLKKNSIFVAIKGEKFDGHKFVNTAVDKGASAVIIRKSQLRYFDNIDKTIVTVKDTTIAYGELARIRRTKLDAKVISITGSNGKTTAKEMIATLLAEKFNVTKSLANNNNHIGVPLTIISSKNNCEVLVLEHGTNHFGEIKFTADIAEPDVAVITNIGDSHLEFLENREGVYKEKVELLKSAEIRNGISLINTDDPIIKKNSKNFKNKITFGFKGKPDIKGKVLGYSNNAYVKMSVSYKGKTIETVLPVIGEASAKNYLIAVSIALILKLNKKEILQGTKKISNISGRLIVSENKENIVIDDTYNASPDSMRNAFDILRKIKNKKRKIFIVGDIFELGDQAKILHENLAEYFLKNKSIEIYCLGLNMKYLYKKLIGKIKTTKYFEDRKLLSEYLKNEKFTDTAIIVKGSRGMKMEEFVQLLNQKAA